MVVTVVLRMLDDLNTEDRSRWSIGPIDNFFDIDNLW